MARRMSYAEMREKGLCTSCGKPNSTPQYSMCPACRERRKAVLQKNNAYRRSVNECLRCGQQIIVGGPTYCRDCMDLQRDHMRDFRANHPGYYKVIKQRAYKERYAKCLAEGLCTECSKRKPDKGHKTCIYCRTKKLRAQREKRKRVLLHPYIERVYWPEEGYCQTCGKAPLKPGYKICESCYQKSCASLAKARSCIKDNYFRKLENGRLKEGERRRNERSKNSMQKL